LQIRDSFFAKKAPDGAGINLFWIFSINLSAQNLLLAFDLADFGPQECGETSQLSIHFQYTIQSSAPLGVLARKSSYGLVYAYVARLK